MASGVVRRAGSLTERQPWADLGVSRATWYRRFRGAGVALAGVGAALAGVILTSIRGVRQDMARLESRLDGKIDALSAQLGELRERMAHLEGLMEGLREAIVGRAKAS